jgi:hypothetical protein
MDSQAVHTAAMSSVFYEEARARGAIWAIRDADGDLASPGTGTTRIVPFWSSPERVHRFVRTSRDHLSFDVVKIPLVEWKVRRWYPSLRRDRARMWLNWRLTDAAPVEVSADQFNTGLFPPRVPKDPRER